MRHLQAGRGAMVGLLAAAAIVAVLVIVFAGPSSGMFSTGNKVSDRPDGKGKTRVGRAMVEAKDSVCVSNLTQIRTALQIAFDPIEGTGPSDLSSLRLPQDLLQCPVGKEPYRYDPATGRVSCPHPGHEGY